MGSKEIIINNLDFYIATEWEIIKAMRTAEAALKDVAIQACADLNVSVNKNRVVEGYYGMDLGDGVSVDNLKEFFYAVKALQGGEISSDKVNSPSLKKLDDLYHESCFGIGPERPTLYYPSSIGWKFKHEEPRYLSGIVDGLYAAMEEVVKEEVIKEESIGWNRDNHKTQKFVQRLAELQQEGKIGTNLVALATLIDRKDHVYEGKIDPICLTYALFTTVLSRAEPCFGAPSYAPKYVWNVDKDVEELGEKVVKAYVQAMQKLFLDVTVQSFHKNNLNECLSAVKKSDFWIGRERVVRIDSDDNQGFLQWATRWSWQEKEQCGRYAVMSFVSPRIINPIVYRSNSHIIDEYNPQPAV